MGKQLGFIHQDLERTPLCTHQLCGGKTTVKTSGIGHLTKSLKKMKMNNLTFRQFSVSKCAMHFSYMGGVVGQRKVGISYTCMYLERFRT